MPLIDPLPKPLEEKLAPAIESKDVVAAVYTDLDLSGRFGEEWLVVTPTRLSVYASNGHGVAPRVELKLEEIKTVSADGLVGGGALLAVVDGKSIEVLRYSNAQQRKFGRIAKYINDVKRYKEDLEKAERGEKDADRQADRGAQGTSAPGTGQGRSEALPRLQAAASGGLQSLPRLHEQRQSHPPHAGLSQATEASDSDDLGDDAGGPLLFTRSGVPDPAADRPGLESGQSRASRSMSGCACSDGW